MRSFWIKFASTVLYFYNSEKRKAFRKKHYVDRKKLDRLRKSGVIGEQTYLGKNTVITDKRSRIGKFCSIADWVHIGTTRHPVNILSSHPVSYLCGAGLLEVKPENRAVFEKSLPVTIGNDVWIGINAVIMDGINIGDGAVIGSGAVVTRDVPPYAVAGGVPARIIKYRFDDKTIQRLLSARWWDRDIETIRNLPMYDVEKSLNILENAD